jgi:hypothetical protein
VGNDSEGVYESGLGYTFVGASGEIAHDLGTGTLFGSITVSGLNWVFNPDTQFHDEDTDALSPATGAGALSPKSSMNGSYATSDGPLSTFGPVTYSTANALAVSQGSVAGTWSGGNLDAGVSIAVDSTGTFTGTTSGALIGTCSLAGTIVQSQPGTAKNMYRVVMNVLDTAMTDDDACTLGNNLAYTGPAAIVLTPAGPLDSSNGFRNISLLIRTDSGSTLSVNLLKQT